MLRFVHLWILTLTFAFYPFAVFSETVKTDADDSEIDLIEAELKKSEVKPKSQSQQSEQPEVKVESLADLSKLSSFSEISVLQRRLLPKSGRFQVFGGLTYMVNDPWFWGFGLNGRAGYYFTEALGIEANLNILSKSNKSQIDDLVSENDVQTSSIINTKNFMGVNVLWTPMYGKLTLFNKRIVPFDMYFTGGVGTMGLDGGRSSSTTAIEFGTGQILALTRSLGFRWDLSYYIFSATQSSGATGSFNSLILTAGFSYHMPEVRQR